MCRPHRVCPARTILPSPSFFHRPNACHPSLWSSLQCRGGGYARGYYDMSFPGREGYSEADHHTAKGLIVVAIDHLGVGDSTLPDLSAITYTSWAATFDAAVREITARLAAGTVHSAFPPLRQSVSIGMGQSLGGAILIKTQGWHATFDAIICLGSSAVHNVLPHRTAAEIERDKELLVSVEYSSPAALSPVGGDHLYAFFFDDVPTEVVNADTKGGYPFRKIVPPFGSRTLPDCALQVMIPGFVAQEAARIEAPVLTVFGERDVSPDPHAEPAAFAKSSDVSLFVVPSMAHMHNFASTRAVLWDRIAGWCGVIARAT